MNFISIIKRKRTVEKGAVERIGEKKWEKTVEDAFVSLLGGGV